MSVFLLGGKAKGFEIFLPAKIPFRPTSVMLRRKFFDYMQDWHEKIFVDLCAGSAAMGFEALSRGAEKVYLNDTSIQQVKLMNRQMEMWCEKFPEDLQKIKITKNDFLKFLKEFEVQSNMWIFFDPPYEDSKLYFDFLEILTKKELPQGSVIVIEFELRIKKPPEWLPNLEKFMSQRKCRELESSDRKLVIIQGI